MTTPDPLGVQIGAREIYDLVLGVDRKVTDTAASVQRLADQHDGLRVDIAEIRAIAAEKETRLRAVERDYVPRTEAQQQITAVREELAEKSRRTIQIIGIIAATCGTAAGVLTAVIIALVQ